jgi:hypothetical protein
VSERIHVQRATTGVWLDRDAQLQLVDRSSPLSKVGVATFVCEPAAWVTAVPEDGLPMFEQWATIVLVEDGDGQLPWRGIVTDCEWSGKTWTITANSMSTYPHGIPYGDEYIESQVDPADVFREMWAHVQSYPDGDLGVVVTGSTPLRIGSVSTKALDAAKAVYADAVKAYDAGIAARRDAAADETDARAAYSVLVAKTETATKALTAARAITPKNQAAINTAQTALNAANAARDAQRTVVNQLTAIHDQKIALVKTLTTAKGKAYDARVAANALVKDDGGAVQLNWWEAPDIGQTIDTLASDNKFDWFERHSWVDDEKSAVRTEIVVVYPRMGRRRDDLYFEQGVNIRAELHVAAAGDDFAQNIVGIGAGEGAGSVRRSTGLRDGHLRRVVVVSAKDAKTNATLDARMQTELATHHEVEEITSVTVVDHPNTPMGSWQTGDDILLRGVLPHLGEIGLWHRITDWKQTSDTTAELTVQRSDAFTYGG